MGKHGGKREGAGRPHGGTGRTGPFGVRLSAELVAWIKQQAAHFEITESEVVRHALECARARWMEQQS